LVRIHWGQLAGFEHSWICRFIKREQFFIEVKRGRCRTPIATVFLNSPVDCLLQDPNAQAHGWSSCVSYVVLVRVLRCYDWGLMVACARVDRPVGGSR